MATAILKCRVCGKGYEACRSAKRVDGVFRWKDVACSPDCGAIYLDLIRKSRGVKNDVVVPVERDFSVIEDEYKDEDEDVVFDLESEDEEFEIKV